MPSMARWCAKPGRWALRRLTTKRSWQWSKAWKKPGGKCCMNRPGNIKNWKRRRRRRQVKGERGKRKEERGKKEPKKPIKFGFLFLPFLCGHFHAATFLNTNHAGSATILQGTFADRRKRHGRNAAVCRTAGFGFSCPDLPLHSVLTARHSAGRRG